MKKDPAANVLAVAERVVFAREHAEWFEERLRKARSAQTTHPSAATAQKVLMLEKVRARAYDVLNDALLDYFEAAEKRDGREPWRDAEQHVEQLLAASLPPEFDFAAKFPHPLNEMAVTVGDEETTRAEGRAAE